MSEIKVDLVSDPSSATNSVAALERKVEELGKSHAQMSQETMKAAKLTQGSYAALERELKTVVKDMKNLEVGSKEFEAAKAKADELATGVAKAKDAMRLGATAAKEEAVAVRLVEGSFEALEQELGEAYRALKKMQIGSAEFEQQKQKVDGLTESVNKAKDAMRMGAVAAKEEAVAVKLVEGSFEALEQELGEAYRALKKMEIGSADFDKQKQKVDRLTDSVNKAKEQLKAGTVEASKQGTAIDKAGDAAARAKQKLGTGGMAGQIGGVVKDFATSLVGFGSIVGGLTAVSTLLLSELQESKRRDNESNTAVRTREQAVANLVQNAGGELTDKVITQAEAVAAVTGSNVEKLLVISSSVASAGKTDEAEIVDIAQMALRSQGGDASRGAAIAGAAIDLSNTLKISVKEAFGVLFQGAGAARPEDIALLGKAAVRATAALTNAGVSAEKSMEMFAATTLLTGDKTGEMSVSIANDLTQAFNKLKTEGIPKSVEVAGKEVAVKVPPGFVDALKDPNLNLDQMLNLARVSPEIEQVVESYLPQSQNVAFTRQIVGGSATYDEKLQAADTAINLQRSAGRADQQVADVEGRRVVGVLEDQVAAVLAENVTNTAAALRATARNAFDAVLERTDQLGGAVDVIADKATRGIAEGRELLGQGTAQARAGVLKDLVSDGKLSAGDSKTALATAALLEKMQQIIDMAARGDLTPRQANAEQAQIRADLGRLNITVKPELRPVEAQAPLAKLSEK